MGHKMKTLNIIEDDISDIEGSIDQATYNNNINRLLDRSGEIKSDSALQSKSPVRKNNFMSKIKEKL